MYTWKMWEVYEHRRLARRLRFLPLEVLKHYEKWKDIVQLSGPAGLLRIKGFRDEGLRGKWRGYRSSRLSRQYRVIYEVLTGRVRVHVIDITAHDYRRK